ncbi:Rha family transcriptional regulator [Vibrio fluvialis]
MRKFRTVRVPSITPPIEPNKISREIAEITGKRHDHVLTDIRNMLVEIQSPEKSGEYKDGRGRNQQLRL